MSHVAELGARDVAAVPAVEGRAGPRHRDAIAAAEEQRPRALRDRQRDRRLAGGSAAVLDLEGVRAGPDRLALRADRGRRPVAWVDADEGRGCARGEQCARHA